ncbi:MAG: hypothetical protein ACAI25_10005 [Planctomycetota bacterium]
MIRPTLGALLVAAILAPAALADDWKFDPKSRPKAKVGQKKTEEGETHQTEVSSISVAEQGEVKKEDKEDRVVFKLHREVKAVDKDKTTEEVVTVEKWVRTATGEPEDKSLEGQKFVLVRNADGKSFTLPDDKEGKVSDGAKAWIQEYYAKKKKKHQKKGPDEDKEADHDDDNGAAKFFPTKPVADGEEWTADPTLLAKEIFGEGDIIDAAKSSAKGKLSKVRVEGGVHHGLIEVKIHFKLKSLPNMPKEMQFEWTDGGDFHMTVAVDGCLDLEKMGGGTFNITGALKGEAKFNAQGQDASLKMDVKQKIAVKSSPGK